MQRQCSVPSHRSCRRPLCACSVKSVAAPRISLCAILVNTRAALRNPQNNDPAFRSSLKLILTPRGSPHCLPRFALPSAQHSLCPFVDPSFLYRSCAGHSSARSPSIEPTTWVVDINNISRPPPQPEHVSLPHSAPASPPSAELYRHYT
jgi:hypothetical protein